MFSRILFVLSVLAGFASSSLAFAQEPAADSSNPVRPVPFVDLDRYTGTWYDGG